jgi:organic radical activating enzyme
MLDKVAFIHEVFCSIQGEGMHVGKKHIFVRFCGCNLYCTFCDTKRAWRKSRFCLIEEGGKVKNPLDRESFLHIILGFERGWVTLTGGEPLLWTSFLSEVLPLLKEEGFLFYLETNGTLPEAFLGIIKYVDVVAMDFKLRSFCGFPPPKEAQERFLSLLKGAKECFVKCVVTALTESWEVKEAASSVASFYGQSPFVIQPAFKEKIPLPHLLSLYDAAHSHLECVRIIPQVHRALRIR